MRWKNIFFFENSYFLLIPLKVFLCITRRLIRLANFVFSFLIPFYSLIFWKLWGGGVLKWLLFGRFFRNRTIEKISGIKRLKFLKFSSLIWYFRPSNWRVLILIKSLEGFKAFEWLPQRAKACLSFSRKPSNHLTPFIDASKSKNLFFKV